MSAKIRIESQKAIKCVKKAVEACFLAGTLAMGAAPAVAEEQKAPTVATNVVPSSDIQAGIASLDPEKKAKIDELKWAMLKFWLTEEQTGLLTFAVATNVIKRAEFCPQESTLKSALDSVDNELSRTLEFNKPIHEITGGFDTITVENYPQFIDNIYGPQRVPTKVWRRVPTETTDASGIITTTFRELTEAEVTDYDTKLMKQVDGLKKQFARITPEEQAWIVEFLNSEIKSLEKNGDLNAETTRRLVLIAGAINASKKPGYFFDIPLNSSMADLPIEQRARLNDRLRRTSSDLSNWATLTGKASQGSNMKVTTELNQKWILVNSSTIQQSPLLAHLGALPSATINSFVVDIGGPIRTALSGVRLDKETEGYKQQSAEARQQSAEARQQSAESDKRIAEARQQSAESDKRIAEARQQSADIDRIGLINEEVDRIAEYLRVSIAKYPTLSEAEQSTLRAQILPKITLLQLKLVNLAKLRAENNRWKEISTSVDANLVYINAVLSRLNIPKNLSVSV